VLVFELNLSVSFSKAYSSTVERAAHNGFAVGSNPAEPNRINYQFSMKLTLKHYKFLKIKNYLKKDKLLLFYNSFDLNSKVWFTLEKFLKSLNLMHYKLHNKITKKVFNQSIYKKFAKCFNGPILFTVFETLLNLFFSTFSSQEAVLTFIGIKINKSFYLFNQTKIVRFLNYKFSIVSFFKFLRKSNKSLAKLF
jgi:hypothetical protein